MLVYLNEFCAVILPRLLCLEFFNRERRGIGFHGILHFGINAKIFFSTVDLRHL